MTQTSRRHPAGDRKDPGRPVPGAGASLRRGTSPTGTSTKPAGHGRTTPGARWRNWWRAGRRRCEADGLQPGDRVAIMLRNSVQWVVFDQAAMGLDLVTVPLYTSDRPDNIAYIVQNSGAKLLLFENADSGTLSPMCRDQLAGLKRVLMLNPAARPSTDPRLKSVDDWLPQARGRSSTSITTPAKLASIIYTSGTTGQTQGRHAVAPEHADQRRRHRCSAST